MKLTIVALSALFLSVASANAVTTDKCWNSTGNWENAATKSCEVYGGGSPKEPASKKPSCEHEAAK